MTDGFALAIGGASTFRRDAMSAERRALHHAGLVRALVAGRDIFAAAGSALDAVTAAVVALEDDPLFNAGRGSVFSSAGTQQMDAAVMEGREHRAGALAGIFGLALPFNCSGMYRSYVKSDGIVYTAIYNEAYRSA